MSKIKTALIAHGFLALTSLVAYAEMPQIKLPELKLAQSYTCGGTCGRARSCEEAVYLWCVCGYTRADRDRDGVPCEKLCGQSTPRNMSRVQSIMKDLGCR